jgi:hypothetical protein
MSLDIDDVESTASPIVEVRTLGDRQVSRVKERVGKELTVWNEHFFFEKNFGSKYEAEGEGVTISFFDHRKILRDSLIGRCEFSLFRLYSAKGHAIEHEWVALANTD